MTKFLFLSICVMFTKKIHMTKIIGLRYWSKLQKALYNTIFIRTPIYLSESGYFLSLTINKIKYTHLNNTY